MKLFLYGGAEINLNQVPILKNLIKETIVGLNPKSVLHIPFARLHSTEEEWKEGWFKETMSDTGIEVLDARNEADTVKAANSVIFINGGRERRDLINTLNSNERLLNLIYQAKYIVSESAGSMVIGEYMRADRHGNEIIKGLSLLKNTIIEVHYSEKNRQQMLLEEMEKSKMKYGIGIDCATALVVDPREFPTKWEKVGIGNLDIKLS